MLLTIPAPVRINVYRSGGQWFEARWIGDEYDGCDALDVDGDASEAEAMETARTMRLAAAGERTVVRVHDLPLPVVRAEAV